MIKLKMSDVKFNIQYRPRGIRNNNPANIRHSHFKWLGLSKVQLDKEFCTFDTMSFGIRALLITLRTYYNKHHCNTIRKVISRFAPSCENNTENYIKFVCDYWSFDPDFKLSLKSCLLLAIPIMYIESHYIVHPETLKEIIEKYHIM